MCVHVYTSVCLLVMCTRTDTYMLCVRACACASIVVCLHVVLL